VASSCLTCDITKKYKNTQTGCLITRLAADKDNSGAKVHGERMLVDALMKLFVASRVRAFPLENADAKIVF
jgi:hypothetical protein